MRPTDYAAEYRQLLKEQGVVILAEDDPYRLKYGCHTVADKQKFLMAEHADEQEDDDNESNRRRNPAGNHGP